MHFAYIFTFLTTIAGPLVVRVLTSLGIGSISYVGINLMLEQIKGYVVSSFSGAGADALALLGLARVDVAINIVLSAVTARAVLSGMQSGAIKKLGAASKS